MSNAVSPSVLANAMEDEFSESQIEVSDDGAVIVTDWFSAGFYNPTELEHFKTSLREFVIQYTELWDVSTVNGNPLEGYYRGVLRQRG